MRLNNFRVSGVSSRDFFQSTSREAGVIMWVQFSQCPPPKICDGKKSSKIFRDFWQLSNFIAYISGTDLHIEHLKKTWSTATPSTLDERNLVNFGPQTKKFYWLELSHPSGFFWGDYISALRGCCAQIFFTRARDWPRLPSAHPNWDGGPPQKKFNREH